MGTTGGEQFIVRVRQILLVATYLARMSLLAGCKPVSQRGDNGAPNIIFLLGLCPNQIGILRNSHGLPDAELPVKTLAQVFLEAGYETAGFGKSHLGHNSSTQGFETGYASEILEKGAIMMTDTDPERKKLYDDETEGYGKEEEDPSGYVGRTCGIPEAVHRDGWVVEKCLEYISRRGDIRPLFLYLSFMKPHTGHNIPEGFEGLHDLDQVGYAKQPPWDKDFSPHKCQLN